MGEYCQVVLDKQSYEPGEIITGRVHCHFVYENNVRNIDLRFKGKAKVYWKVGKQAHIDEQLYFEMETPLLQGETKFPPGDYDYPFSFNLKDGLPSSACGKHGSIKYTVVANVDRPLALDYKYEQPFTVFSTNKLYLREYDKPLEITKEHIPAWNWFSNNPIRLTITMPKRNYLISELVPFSVSLENLSNVNVNEVRFKLAQGFLYYAGESDTSSYDWEGQEYAIVDGFLPSKSERKWELELRIPTDMFAGYIWTCKVMKPLWELQGEIVLPFPNTNMKVKIPIHVGVTDV